ncbi:hypothetical protein DICA1_D13960 [Diutina catenulata]
MGEKRSSSDDSKKVVKKPTKTTPALRVSLCVPSTVISSKNAYNLEQQTAIVYQIARAATAYDVGEIVVLDVPEPREPAVESAALPKQTKLTFDDEPLPHEEAQETTKESASSLSDAVLVAALLQYFVTPPHLVKTVFANSAFPEVVHKFKHASKLPKISTLPFMANNDVHAHFREAVAIAKQTPPVVKKGKKVKAERKLAVTKWVNIGADEALKLDIKREIPVGARVTVDIRNNTIVSPQEAYGVTGNKSSFGYYTRVASKFSSVFTEAAVADGYTGSLVVNCDDYFVKASSEADYNALPIYKPASEGNILAVFGNYRDLTRSFKDDSANLAGIESVGQMFDAKLVAPNGVRIEDACLIALAKIY